MKGKEENKQEVQNEIVESLNEKTRAQLIEIILRKDAVERTLRNTIKDLHKYNNRIKIIEGEIANVTSELIQERNAHNQTKIDLEVNNDEYTSLLLEIQSKCFKYKILSFVIGVIAILAFIFGFTGI